MIQLGDDRYGKQAIRLLRVVRDADRHVVRDLTVGVTLGGAFAASYVDGDNSDVIATDTMKNTVYAFAREHLGGATSMESFGRVLAEHFAAAAQVERATVALREHRWARLSVAGGGPATDAFARDGSWTRIASVAATRTGVTIEAGIEDLAVLKTTKSSFTGFPRDAYTTLPEAADRLMATQVSARWRYVSPDIDHDALFEAVRATFLEVFVEHDSPSVQASIWIIGRAILERHPEVDEISMSLPNLHHWLVDLGPFGLDNPGLVFTPTREPHGLIEATVRRG
ncbi:MAG: urate oxidase [Chloroflexota bacterium]|nr:urate oxidase [Chloroflexota bacterium]